MSPAKCGLKSWISVPTFSFTTATSGIPSSSSWGFREDSSAASCGQTEGHRPPTFNGGAQVRVSQVLQRRAGAFGETQISVGQEDSGHGRSHGPQTQRPHPHLDQFPFQSGPGRHCGTHDSRELRSSLGQNNNKTKRAPSEHE
ncbi:unnamed protein product, partial [Menidia menidia]